MPQFDEIHEYLRLRPADCQSYEFVVALLAKCNGKTAFAGTGCLIAPGLVVTAKHILEYLHITVAGKKIDFQDPDQRESPQGRRIALPDNLGVDVLQFIDGREDARRYGVTGCIEIGYRKCDLAVLTVEPHPGCPHRNEPWTEIMPVLDLAVPAVGTTVSGYGYPNHPSYPNAASDEYLSDHWIYRSEGKVEEIFFDESQTNLVSYSTTMRTKSGMSGGPVFARRDGEDVFCGIISSGDESNYSRISPLWQLAWTCIDARPGMPDRQGFSMFVDMMKGGFIKTKWAKYLSVDEETLTVRFDYRELLENGW